MKPQMRSMKFLAMTITLAALATGWAIWGAMPANAIIVIGSTTGMVTLTQGEALSVNVANTSGEVAIIDDGDIFDSQGRSLMEIPMTRLEPGHATSFQFMPRLADGQQLPVRVHLIVEGNSVKDGRVIPTCEIFDTATGKTSILLGPDFIIDDGK